MKLITELTESVEYLIEGSGDSKKYYIEGIFAQADTPNRNGRIYPMHVMESAIDAFQETIKAKRAMGELNHPQGPTINLDRVSHLIESLTFKGSDVYGKAKILDTPMGRIAKNLIDEGVQLGVSTRGLGSLKTNGRGIQEVQSDFRMNTVDIVADPSAPSAFVNGIMEGTEYFVTPDGRLEEKTIEFIKAKRLTEERKLQAFEMFLKGLTESVVVDTDSYKRSHMRNPSGEGTWIFHRGKIGSLDFSKHKAGQDYMHYVGPYNEAKKAAKNWAKEKGHSWIKVAP